MNEQQRQELRAKLALITTNERQKLYKRAAEIRKHQPPPTMRGRPSRFAPDEDGEERSKIRPRSSSLDDLVLKLLHEDDAAQADHDGPRGTVLSVTAGRADVHFGGEVVTCRLSRDIRMRQQSEIAVGDEVVIQGDEPTITAILPRRTKLSRPDPQGAQERLIVANVDTIVVVVSVVAPPLHPRLIDRYLVAIRRGGARAVLAVNKTDLDGAEAEMASLAPYRDLLPIIPVSAQSGAGLDALRRELSGQLSAFVGHSGVGKSSLLNALCPALGLETGAVSEGYGRGTHTTRGSSLHDLGDGLRIIDTPGVRMFGLWAVEADELAEAFPEFQTLECRFRDCTHTHEPGCGVQAAVTSGRVSSERFDTYRRLLSALT